MKEAGYWLAEEGRVRCCLCPQNCLIAEGKSGFCRARKNVSGKLNSLIYGQITSANLDPIEKKPLYHFYPGRMIFSIGTFGCNLRCPFCQNWQISQQTVPTEPLSPEQAVDMAKGYRSVGIAFTYNEPFIWFEYVLDTARLAREKGLKNVLVTNGFANEEPLKEILPLIDAMNIDLKAMDAEFYREKLSGELAPVLNTIKLSHDACHVELTNLLIPGQNDSNEQIQKLVDWVADLCPDIPLHFSRYFPQYKLNLPTTSLATMDEAAVIAKRKLRYVYIGNVDDDAGSTTFCPDCRKPLVERSGYIVAKNEVSKGACKHCHAPLPGLWE